MSENIQVVVRCRARNDREVAAKSPPIVELPNDVHSSAEPLVTITHEPSSLFSSQTARSVCGKVFKVDQVYGPNADQALLFDNVALPLFHDFLSGLNVTLLAYGQTGSGKTYSMCGDLKGEHAGMIPRVLSRLFASLDGDFMVKLSCVELYKEELHDLINDELDIAPVRSKLRLVSDATNSVASIQNLTEVHIDNCDMGFKILQKCLNKRRTSATKLNDLSSRSHTIFTINLYRRVDSSSGAPAYHISKMNLVDLAGSEDINKSGATKERAREAGSINQSLLTLGKVINSLSEGKEPKHIPYRESKLTRLLQGSIGGRTKTALIATISPAKINANETISTLNYASKAKNIRNLPQSIHDSDLVLKKVLVGDLSTQIARLTRDLMASKDKDGGIKMSIENYEQVNTNIVNLQMSLKEESAKVASLNTKLESRNLEIEALRKQLIETEESKLAIKREVETKSNEVSALSLTMTDLQARYSSQKQQVTKVMENNIHDVNNSLKLILQSVGLENNRLSGEIDSLRRTVARQVRDLQSKLDGRLEEASAFVDRDLPDAINTILMGKLDVSDAIKHLNNFDVDAQLQKIAIMNLSLGAQMDKCLSLDPHKQLLENTVRTFSNEQKSFKSTLLAQISESLEVYLKDNLSKLERLMFSTANEVIQKNKSTLKRLHENTSHESQRIIKDVSAEARGHKRKISELDKVALKMISGASLEIADVIHGRFSSTIKDITNVTKTENGKTIERLDSGLGTLATEVRRSSRSTTKELEAATSELQTFSSVLANLKESPTRPTSIPRSPIKSPLRGEVKRRKPMVPLHENGLASSRIPQLHQK